MRTLLFLMAGTAFAQSTGSITGKIVDEFGIPVADASVIVKSASGQEFKSTSALTGEYAIDKLPVGTYEIKISALTMKDFVKQDVVTSEGQTSRLDVRMLGGGGLGTLGDTDRFTRAVLNRRGSAPPAGAAPRMADGKPDLSGYWARVPLAKDFLSDALPWADAIRIERERNNERDYPPSRCLPYSIMDRGGEGKFIQTSSLLLMLDSGEPARTVFLDFRAHPKELNPTWLGHSVGHWEGDTLVVETVGFNGLAWFADLPWTENLVVIERFRRPDLGHLEYEVTLRDPAVLRQPWTLKLNRNLDPKEDIEEFVCSENEKDQQHLLDK